MKSNYLFNQDTIAVYSNFSRGNEYSGVLQGDHNIFVSQPPLTIVENSFLEMGTDYNGALRSARHILKKKCHVPAALSVPYNIILIRCKAASKQGGTVWIVAKHIVRIEPYKTNQSLIHTTGGHTLYVDMNPRKLQSIRDMATILHSTLAEKQKMRKDLNGIDEKKGFILIKEDGQINYTIKKKED